MTSIVKERPILMSAPMVRAILEGSKTQTRRIVKPQPKPCSHKAWSTDDMPNWACDQDGWHCSTCGNGVRLAHTKRGVSGIVCPYGKPGDRMWVRETHAILTGRGHRTVYAADGHPMTEGGKTPVSPMRWSPSVFMPRRLSRITLEVTEVRVQRLQEISEEDAIAEGLRIHENPACAIGVGRFMYTAFPGEHSKWELDAKTAYRDIWESINGPGSWNVNPWVWVVSFKQATA